MIKSFEGKTPVIAPSAYVSAAALIIGEVEIGEDCSLWPFAVVRGDRGKVVIGKNSHVAEHALLHGPLEVGEGCVLGYGAIVESGKIGNQVLIGSHASVLGPVEIGDNAIVGANAVVRRGSRLPAHCLCLGVPAQPVKVLPLEQSHKLLDEVKLDLIPLVKKYKEQGL